jgi:hypothetical protein
MSLQTTCHAVKRQNQRGISDDAVDLAISHGHRYRLDSAIGYYVSPSQVERLRRSVPELEYACKLHVIVDLTKTVFITAYFKNKCQFKRDHKPRSRAA